MSFFRMQAGSSEISGPGFRTISTSDDADDFEGSEDGESQEPEGGPGTGTGESGYPVPESGEK